MLPASTSFASSAPVIWAGLPVLQAKASPNCSDWFRDGHVTSVWPIRVSLRVYPGPTGKALSCHWLYCAISNGIQQQCLKPELCCGVFRPLGREPTNPARFSGAPLPCSARRVVVTPAGPGRGEPRTGVTPPPSVQPRALTPNPGLSFPGAVVGTLQRHSASFLLARAGDGSCPGLTHRLLRRGLPNDL